jgi:hypothetical protein
MQSKAAVQLLGVFMGYRTRFATILCSALVASCGGTDDSINAAAALAGNWAWAYGCDASLTIRVNETTPAYQLMAIKDLKAVDTKTATGIAETRVFDNSTCSGSAVATHVRSISFTIDNVVLVKGKPILQVTRSLGSVGASVNPAISTVPDPLIYPADYFTKTSSGKDLVYADSQHWYFGFDAPSPFDLTPPSDAYPAELLDSPSFVRG